MGLLDWLSVLLNGPHVPYPTPLPGCIRRHFECHDTYCDVCGCALMWICVCRKRRPMFADFCSSCGARHPDVLPWGRGTTKERRVQMARESQLYQQYLDQHKAWARRYTPMSS